MEDNKVFKYYEIANKIAIEEMNNSLSYSYYLKIFNKYCDIDTNLTSADLFLELSMSLDIDSFIDINGLEEDEIEIINILVILEIVNALIDEYIDTMEMEEVGLNEYCKVWELFDNYKKYLIGIFEEKSSVKIDVLEEYISKLRGFIFKYIQENKEPSSIVEWE